MPAPTARAPARAPARAVRLLGLLLGLLVLLVLPASVADAGAGWLWPLPGAHVVSRPFAPGATPYSAGHRGADLPAPTGVPVGAAGAGRVSYAGLLAGRGVVVVVHGPLRTTYEPVTPTVSVGQAVTAGQQLGTLDPGHDGCPVAACLHWGLLRGAVYLDPVQLVDSGPVRLLPLDAPLVPLGGPRLPAGAALLPAGAALLPAGAALLPAGAALLPAAESTPSPGHRTAVAGTALALVAGTTRWWRRSRSHSHSHSHSHRAQ